MNEKKLNDEEVLKALDICYTSHCCTNECPYFNKNGRNFCVENKALYKDMKRIVQEHAEQKAEIERLTEENEYLDMVAKQALTDYQNTQVQVDELKAKKDLSIANIEKELTNYLFMGCSYGALVCGKMSFDIAEKRAKEFAPLLYGFIQQAVKDTAKEILQGFMKWLNQAINESYDKSVKGSIHYGGKNRAFHEVKELVKKVAEEKGVEVE